MSTTVTVNLELILSDALDKAITKYNGDMDRRKWEGMDTFQMEAIKQYAKEEILRVIK